MQFVALAETWGLELAGAVEAVHGAGFALIRRGGLAFDFFWGLGQLRRGFGSRVLDHGVEVARHYYRAVSSRV